MAVGCWLPSWCMPYICIWRHIIVKNIFKNMNYLKRNNLVWNMEQTKITFDIVFVDFFALTVCLVVSQFLILYSLRWGKKRFWRWKRQNYLNIMATDPRESIFVYIVSGQRQSKMLMPLIWTIHKNEILNADMTPQQVQSAKDLFFHSFLLLLVRLMVHSSWLINSMEIGSFTYV